MTTGRIHVSSSQHAEAADGSIGGGGVDADDSGVDADNIVVHSNGGAFEAREKRSRAHVECGKGERPLGPPPRNSGTEVSRSDNALLHAEMAVRRTDGLLAVTRRGSRLKSRAKSKSRSKSRSKSKKRTKLAMLELKTQQLHHALLTTTGAI